MLRFEANTSSFEKRMDSLRDTAEDTIEKALDYADGLIREKARLYAPVHVDGYVLGENEWYPGGTLMNSFTVWSTEIGDYSISSIYRMSGETNPVSGGWDYALEMELEKISHRKGKPFYLRSAVEESSVPTLKFIANHLYLYME